MAGKLQIETDTTGKYVGFSAPVSVDTETIWTLPDADGSSGDCLITDGSGALSWGEPAVDVSTQLDSEVLAREAMDSTLQDNIDAEAAVRAAMDSTLQNSIDAEADARAAMDSTLQNNIDAEAAVRAAMDSTLQNSIDAEAAGRAAMDSSLQASIDAIDLTSIEALVTTEEQARMLVDSSLQVELDTTQGSVGVLGDGGWHASIFEGTTYLDNALTLASAIRKLDCELQSVASKLNIEEITFTYDGTTWNPSVTLDKNYTALGITANIASITTAERWVCGPDCIKYDGSAFGLSIDTIYYYDGSTYADIFGSVANNDTITITAIAFSA